MPRALITDAEERSVLAACRSLHCGGYTVDAAASHRPAVAHWSRSCSERFSVTDPKRDPARFVEEVASFAERGAHDVLIPGSDAALLAISKGRRRLDPLVRIGLPDEGAVERSLSKVALIDAGFAAGLPSPETVVCADHDAATAAARRLGYPVVFKPHQSVYADGSGFSQRGSILVENEAELLRLLPDYGSPCLVQRVHPGSVVSFGGVITAGEIVACVVSRYERTWPPHAGNVSASETVPTPGDMRGRVRDLMNVLGWEGIFELELLEADGAMHTIDLNPRVYGSLALGERAGVPLALIWAEWLLGRSSSPASAEPGRRYRWDDAELRNLWWRVRRGRLRGALTLLRPHRATVWAHLSASDPLPFLARMTVLFRKWIRYMRGRTRRADAPARSDKPSRLR